MKKVRFLESILITNAKVLDYSLIIRDENTAGY